MKANKFVKKQSKKSSKKSFNIDNQEDIRIISMDELIARHGITGNKTHYFLSYLISYYTGNLHGLESDNLIGVAKYIYQEDKWYFKTEGGYKRMKFSSIKDNIYQLSVQAMEEVTSPK